MKSNINKDVSPIVRYIIMCVLGLISAIVFCYTATAQSAHTQPENEWIETVCVELPQGLEVFSGITRNGNPKYWFEIEGLKVFISPTNKEHYLNDTRTILLVEWYNKEKDIYRYTTRQKSDTKKPKKINLNSL